jgi:D-alanyl-D-alanine-carboxypeptidase/D-alanyl-D-alanine-endopeptidase
MKKLIVLFVVNIFLVISCSTGPIIRKPSDTPKSDFQDDKISERIKAAITPQIGTKNVGAIVAIYNKGSLNFFSFGETKIGNKTLPTPDTIFEIGSITKTFTGLMLSRSIDLDRVIATETIDQFQDEWKNQKAGSITLTELITHRSGLPRIPCNLKPNDPKYPYLDYTEKNLLESFHDSAFSANCFLNSHPTSAINYSNWGVATLGYVLASRQKTSYEKLLHELVLDPLDLSDTRITLSSDQKMRVATGYDIDLNEVDMWDRQILLGNGALRSSARDLIKYARVYLHPEQTPFENSIRRVTQVSYETKNMAIGYAWFIKKSGSIWHNGSTGGYFSFMKIYPASDLIILFMTNTSRDLKCFVSAVENVPCNPLED